MANLISTELDETLTGESDVRRSGVILGMRLTPMDVDELLRTLETSVGRRQCVIAYQNLHGMRLTYLNENIRRLHECDDTLVYIDGFPVYLLCRMFGWPVRRHQRITGNDYIWPLLTLAQRSGWRVYFLGSTEETIAAASARIHQQMPNLIFRAHHGFFDNTTENAGVLDDITEFSADLVVVCMGMPLQEQWILENAKHLGTTSLCAMGAILEYVAGVSRVPPRWLGPVGLEWAFRLLENPKRFAFRYLMEPWLLLGNLIRFAVKRR